jgi:cytosine/adenosine deaminase-related metal-dependent hydrolase
MVSIYRKKGVIYTKPEMGDNFCFEIFFPHGQKFSTFNFQLSICTLCINQNFTFATQLICKKNMIYLRNATYIDPVSMEFVEGNIKVAEGADETIEFINVIPDFDGKNEIIDCRGKIVTQSFACGHHHAYSGLACGMPAPAKNPANFYEILEQIWWKLDKCLDRETIEASAWATAMACIRNGVTFIIDHHASPNFIEGSLDILAEVFDKAGISHLLCYEISDRDGLDKSARALNYTDDYLTRHQGLIGLHASFTVGNETLDAAMKLVEKHDSGLHIHVAEDLFDQQHCKETYGMGVVQRLANAGALETHKTILAHCLHLSDEERLLIKRSQVYVAQNAESNLNNRVGSFSANGLGYNTMLGTDGMNSDMLRSMRMAYFTGQGREAITPATAYYRLRKANEYVRFNDYKGDTANNLIIMDNTTATELNSDNLLGHIVFGWDSRNIRHVISSGKIVMKDGVFQNFDEENTLKFTREQSRRLWQNMQK